MIQASSPVPDLSYPPEARRWPPAFPPACAVAWGDDQYGLWIDVMIGGPLQRFRWIEPGEFVMGSPEGEEARDDDEGPQHVVRLTEGYWLAETACSQALWSAVMGTNPSRFQGDSQNPVERVDWENVSGFLCKVEALLSGVKAELPSEAEWEYACRGGTDTTFSWGDGITSEYANYNASSRYLGGPTGEYRDRTVPVKSFTPNAWGLYQMHGNVYEWCADGPRDYDSTPQVNPRGPDKDSDWRVVRGGSWFHVPRSLRAAYRGGRLRGWRGDARGFRFLLRPVPPAVERPLDADVTHERSA